MKLRFPFTRFEIVFFDITVTIVKEHEKLQSYIYQTIYDEQMCMHFVFPQMLKEEHFDTSSRVVTANKIAGMKQACQRPRKNT